MKITLSKALKLKKKMTGNIAKIMSQIRENNSFLEEKKGPYDVLKLYRDYEKEVESLVALKIAVNKANEPIMELITRIPELKSKIGWLNNLIVEEGKEYASYGSAIMITRVAIIKALDRDRLVVIAQEELERIQDVIDHHNATTEIEL